MLLFTLALCLLGCKKAETAEPLVLNVVGDGVALFDAEGGSRTIKLETNIHTIQVGISSGAETWLTHKLSGNTLTVFATANQSDTSREGGITLSGGGISKQVKVVQGGTDAFILVSKKVLALDEYGGETTLDVLSNREIQVEIPSDLDWIKLQNSTPGDAKDKRLVTFHVKPLADGSRQARLTLKAKGSACQEVVELTQTANKEYKPAENVSISSDHQVKVARATASSYQKGEGIDKAIDGDMSTIYHSDWNNRGSNYFPITLEFFFANEEDVDYFIYTPRTNGYNGHFKLIELFAKDAAHADYFKVAEKDLKGLELPSKIVFDAPLKKAKSFKIVVKSGHGDGQGFASAAEIQFFRYSKEKSDELAEVNKIFTDASASELRPGVSDADVAEMSSPVFMQIARHLKAGTYPGEFRIQDYRAWPHPNDWVKVSKTGEQNLLDNPTGIAAEKGKDLIVLVGDTHGHVGLSMKIQNLDTPGADGYNEGSSTYVLSPGLNKITPANSGLIYILYHRPDYMSAAPIRIHFATGKVNGYYDSQKHKPEDWTRLLAGATDKFFDVLGERAHLTFTTEGFRKYASTDGPKLIAQYDEMVQMMTDFMGLKKYNLPKVNRSYFHAMYHSYMYATSYRTAYNFSDDGVVKSMCSRTEMRRSPWGHAHETGHTLQTRPGFRWIGMVEVTNNIMANLVTVNWGNESRLQSENRYLHAYNLFFIDRSGISSGWQKRAYLYTNEVYDKVFEKLVPLWQVYLYFTKVKGMTDFYTDFYQKVRTNPNPATSELCQLECAKLMCEVSGYNLIDFFEAWGFFTPYKGEIKDYGNPTNANLSEELIASYKSKITALNLPKPTAAIQYITDGNLDLYRKMLPVSGGAFLRESNKVTVTNCANAVAYEVVIDGKVVYVSPKPSFDLPAEVATSTHKMTVRAIAADGKRTVLPKK